MAFLIQVTRINALFLGKTLFQKPIHIKMRMLYRILFFPFIPPRKCRI